MPNVTQEGGDGIWTTDREGERQCILLKNINFCTCSYLSYLYNERHSMQSVNLHEWQQYSAPIAICLATQFSSDPYDAFSVTRWHMSWRTVITTSCRHRTHPHLPNRPFLERHKTFGTNSSTKAPNHAHAIGDNPFPSRRILQPRTPAGGSCGVG